MQRRFVEVDVFTALPYRGNPLAVVIDGEGLSTEEMQRFANWTNFSETTFLVPPTDPAADYAVRIFTTTTELPFAGHPTLGSCHAWLRHGGVPTSDDEVVQECGVGLVRIRRDDSRLAFAAPPLRREGPLDEATLAEAAAAIGVAVEDVIDSAWIDNGPGWLGLLLRSADDVLAIRGVRTPLKVGVAGPHPDGSPTAYEVRAFFPEGDQSFEDPVTGSLNASMAQWLVARGRCTPPYAVSQGAALGRAGIVHVTADDTGQLWIGGDVTTCVEGRVAL
ncbi:MAG: PhzF family phenazine biosynthesis protein [Ilumatobacteraceae bacterium]